MAASAEVELEEGEVVAASAEVELEEATAEPGGSGGTGGAGRGGGLRLTPVVGVPGGGVSSGCVPGGASLVVL